MTCRLLKLFLLIFALSFISYSFSQKMVKGIYHLVSNPTDADVCPDNEFPVYSNKVKIKLKGNNKFESITTDLDGDNEHVTYGKYSVEGNLIRLEFHSSTRSETVFFDMVELKSGTYIKLKEKCFGYYKKEQFLEK